ncbi:major royal jelly family protein [Enterobacter sp. PI-10]|uniref:L-dopachrome tautomerase-related protein n=1 Tax=Enterobacter sp. PI-10 TaxID=2899140 RepID=UPI0023017377|nr:L-dopachrome tautomerase-related protein [Enterobacter sp. PI-10]MDA5602799.1 major royal jelly family protein [Enterobacter sp. PI-10]
MFNRPLILPAIAMAALFSFPSVVNAANHAPLERWRSYAGVSWDTAQDGKIPAAFSGSVNAPIAGIHFDAKDRAFVSTPRLVSTAAPATLSILDTTVQSGPARLTAFPSREGNAVNTDPAQSLRNVLGFYIDRKNGWLWALDMGFVAGETESPAGSQKLVVLDLSSGRTIKRIALDGVADRKASFLNDVVVDENRRVAYISDSGSRSAPENQVGLIIVDFAAGTARRVLDRHPALQIEPGVNVVSHGAEVWPGKPLLIGINGIALSPDAGTLYWTVTTGTRAYAVPTAILRQPASTDAQIAGQIRNLGSVGGNTDGMVTDVKGNLYITDVTRNGIVRYDPESLSMSLIAASQAVHWPDTPAIRPNGDLVFTSSRLNDHFAGAVKPGEERYDLWRLPLSALQK